MSRQGAPVSRIAAWPAIALAAIGLPIAYYWAAASTRAPDHHPAPAPSAPASILADAASAEQEAASGDSAVHPSRLRRVVLITIDTLRADQPWTGYDKLRTPALSKLASNSLVFLHAYSLANTTGPSLGGMLTSRYPTELLRDDCPLAGMDIEQGLAERLSSSGAWTAAVHGHPYFASSAAPRTGFLQWRTVANVLGRRATDGAVTGPEVTDIAIEVLRSAPVDRPVLLWVHYVDPHDKYVAHVGFPPSANPVRGMYDGEVAFTDHHVGRLLDEIGSSGEADATAVIVTADHGEAFGEHGAWRHGTTVYQEELRVPLLVHVPGLAPARVEAARSTIDVAPTIAALLGVQPPARWRGSSLIAKDLEEARPVLVDCPALMNAPARRAAILGQHKVMGAPGAESAFDLAADPDERRPLPAETAAPLIESARRLYESIHAVPSRKCARQAFRQ